MTANLFSIDVETKWQKIKSEKDLAIRPILRLMGTDMYPLIKIDR
jgi:hypothetical protein